jgi:hypothetical protein
MELFPTPMTTLLTIFNDFNAFETRSDDAKLINAVVDETSPPMKKIASRHGGRSNVGALMN